MIPDLLQFYILVIITFLSYCVTYLTTHHPLFNLGQVEMLNRKPFTCWLCSNIWCNMFVMVNLAYLWDVMFLVWGAIFTGITTFIIWHDGW